MHVFRRLNDSCKARTYKYMDYKKILGCKVYPYDVVSLFEKWDALASPINQQIQNILTHWWNLHPGTIKVCVLY